MIYPTIEDAIGKTPLVALQRLGAADAKARNNVILGKLEGNNPAGSVKDRPALSMIRRAEERGEIKPGDTLTHTQTGSKFDIVDPLSKLFGFGKVVDRNKDSFWGKADAAIYYLDNIAREFSA